MVTKFFNLFLLLFCFILFYSFAFAVEVNPTKEQVAKTIQKGEKRIDHPLQIPNMFGTAGSCGWGFLQSKLWNLWAGSQLSAKKSKTLSEREIERILASPTMIVSYHFCTDHPREKKVRVLLKQGERVIKPEKIQIDPPMIISAWPKTPRYDINTLAYFSYGSFDPKATTDIIVIDESGKQFQYQVSLANVP